MSHLKPWAGQILNTDQQNPRNTSITTFVGQCWEDTVRLKKLALYISLGGIAIPLLFIECYLTPLALKTGGEILDLANLSNTINSLNIFNLIQLANPFFNRLIFTWALGLTFIFGVSGFLLRFMILSLQQDSPFNLRTLMREEGRRWFVVFALRMWLFIPLVILWLVFLGHMPFIGMIGTALFLLALGYMVYKPISVLFAMNEVFRFRTILQNAQAFNAAFVHFFVGWMIYGLAIGAMYLRDLLQHWVLNWQPGYLLSATVKGIPLTHFLYQGVESSLIAVVIMLCSTICARFVWNEVLDKRLPTSSDL